MDRLKDEVEYRKSQGLKQLSKEQVCELFKNLGYILEVSDPCYYTGLYMTGDRAGTSYPAVSYRILEASSKRSAFHVDSDRGKNYQEMQKLRHEVFFSTARAVCDL